ncbi:hypothetical protein GCM10010387_13800 [Streptomyces inusitatus]|uniref:Secreted protein n=1 Tax=Streptomyces inusitatus TaxID=68221 RepID=A0A918UMU5_9ACTN|nr:hypothetical protein [Streptomyces inusitatus]GGZ21909.1 hypothetical protein GCM10010387_13800 [Streptomyces inusitatus]
MRRIASLLGSLAAAVALTVTVPHSAAFAANGAIMLNGTVHQQPSGCYPSDRRPFQVNNRTDEIALVFASRDCSGPVLQVVAQGEPTVSEQGRSLYIP